MKWYSILIGLFLSLSGAIFLIFDPKEFIIPNWYLGVMVLLGLVGIFMGFMAMKSKPMDEIESPADQQNKKQNEVK